jgi:ABC-2 type transport system permease protein
MSTTAAASQVATAQLRPAGRVGFGHLMLAEWTKIRSVRSTVWSLAIFVVGTIGLTALFCWLTVHAIQTGRAPRRSADLLGDPVTFILQTGIGFGQLAICVLGALTMTTEYSTGVIRASLLAVPRRLPVVAAKCTVFAGLIFVIAEIVVFVSFFVGKAIIHPVVDVSLSQPNVARAVVGAGLYLTVLGLFALAIGLLIRHSAGAIATVIGLVLVVGPLLGLLDSYYWGKHVHDWFPTVAGGFVRNVIPASDQVLSPWEGFAVFCGWTALLLAGGAYLLKRRDA